MLEIKIASKIEDKINELQKETGCTKKFIADRLDMLPQTMNKLIKSNNITIETLVKFSYVLKCKPEELYEYQIKDL